MRRYSATDILPRRLSCGLCLLLLDLCTTRKQLNKFQAEVIRSDSRRLSVRQAVAGRYPCLRLEQPKKNAEVRVPKFETRMRRIM